MELKLDAHTVRRIAVAAKRSPRTVERFLKGEPGKPTADAAIAQALREHLAWRDVGQLEAQLLAAETSGDAKRARELRAEILAARDQLDDLRRGAP